MPQRTYVCLFLLVVVAAICRISIVAAQDETELTGLQAENARLRVALDNANAKIDALEKQIEALRAKHAKDDEKRAEDLFTVGSVWSGSRFYNQNVQNGKGPDREGQPWTMKVTERDGNRFKAEISFTAFDGLQKEITVAGTAPLTEKGRVTFRTDQKGIFQQSFKGILAGRQVSLEFDGTSVNATRVFGTGHLKRE
jgi:hypothetical protein